MLFRSFAALAVTYRSKAPDAAPEELAELKQLLDTHAQTLRKKADELSGQYGPKCWPASPDAMRAMADEAVRRAK